MPYVVIVTVLVLVQFFVFGLQVGGARRKYGVHAPAISGNEIFERHFRVHMNTLEQLVVFLPTLWIYASFVSPQWGAAFGAVFLVGRAIYGISYVRDPKSRGLGFGLTTLPTFVMLVWLIVWAVRAIANGAAS